MRILVYLLFFTTLPILASSLALEKSPSPLRVKADKVKGGYVIPIQIGNQPFNVLLDTGSAFLWVPSAECTACKQTKKVYNSSLSPSYVDYNIYHRLSYGNGSLNGTFILGMDTLTIGGLTITNQTFSRGLDLHGFKNFSYDGILGLGFLPDGVIIVKDMYSIRTVPFTLPSQNMFERGLIPSNLFSIWLDASSNTGEILFGATDTAKHKENLSYYNLLPYLTDKPYWKAQINSVEIGSSPLNITEVIFDTGAPHLYVPSPAYKIIVDKTGTKTGTVLNGLRSVDYCLPYPDLNFVFTLRDGNENQQFVVPSSSYFENDENKKACYLQFESNNNLPGSLMGYPFTKLYYTVYDSSTTPPRIGFAPSIPSNPSNTSPPRLFNQASL